MYKLTPVKYTNCINYIKSQIKVLKDLDKMHYTNRS